MSPSSNLLPTLPRSGLPILVSHALCPYVQRAVIALKEKQLPYERIDIDLKNKPAWFLALSPLGKTPVLVVTTDTGREALFESAVICDYLDETQRPALHPSDPLQRARHRAWIEFASAVLVRIGNFYNAADASALWKTRDEIAAMFQHLETQLGDGPWFAGASFSLIDAAFGPVFRYFDVFDEIVDSEVTGDLPRLSLWRENLKQRASVRAAVGPEYSRRLRDFVSARGSYLGHLIDAQSVASA